MIKKIIKKAGKKIKFINLIIIKRRYGQKNNMNFLSSMSNIKILPFDYKVILQKSNNLNRSSTCFYYGLDTKCVVYSPKSLVGNMPIDYSYVLDNGLNGIKDIELKCEIEKYIDRANDNRIKKEPVTNLKDALQMILFWNQLLWQSGHRLNGLGRLDKVLNKYPPTDDVKNIIKEFLKTLHYGYEYKSNALKGDIGQIIIVGGLETDGSYYRNLYTDLFVECMNELHLPDPKLLLRVSFNIPKSLVDKSIQCISTGSGSPLLSNDNAIIPLLEDFGYKKEDAYNYGVSACWEPLSIGNSLEQNNLDNIEFGRCIHDTIVDANFVKCKNFEEVFTLFLEKLQKNILMVRNNLDKIEWEEDKLVSSLMNLNLDITKGGARYSDYGILSTGMSSAVDSLININNYVFIRKKYTLKEIQNIISKNYPCGVEVFDDNSFGYGTDNFESIDLTNKIIAATENGFQNYRNKLGGRVKFGLSSSSYMDYGKITGATLDGRKDNQPFSTHISRDKGESITEIMNFESNLKFSGISSNANVIDIMVQSSLIKDNADKFTTYIMSGIKKGIFQLQVNVLSYEQLVDAKAHPEKYPNLIVRVWGFSAYFNDLPEEYKDNLIRRAKNMEYIT